FKFVNRFRIQYVPHNHIFPSDQDTEPIVTSRPDGSPLVLKIRDIELENNRKLKNMEGIHVISDFAEIKTLILRKIEGIQ
ncbi:unnamed protein product, partial [marine sediment metagenome]